MIQTSVDSTIRTGAPRSAEQSMRNSMQLLRIIHSVMQQQSLRSLSVVFPSNACQLDPNGRSVLVGSLGGRGATERQVR
jgi:hypothetical protein